MSRVRSKNTRPELLVRRFVHGMGYRYRLHRRSLPGAPDLVFVGRRKVIFVHGCFWHRHRSCSRARMPKSRTDYWGPKLRRNVERDSDNRSALAALGWETMTVWECEIGNSAVLARRIRSFLGPREENGVQEGVAPYPNFG